MTKIIFVALFATLSFASVNDDLRTQFKKLEKISGKNRSVGSRGNKKARRYLLKFMKKNAARLGGKVYIHKFFPDVDFAIKTTTDDFKNLVAKKFKKKDPIYKKWFSFTREAIQFYRKYRKVEGQNLVLEIPGTERPNKVMYFGTHYDTLTHNPATMKFTPKKRAPSADDNGSGIIVLMNTIAKLKKAAPYTMRFVFFDYEEIFFLGSYEFAKKISAKELPWQKPKEANMGLVALEMLGWSKKKLMAKVYTRKLGEEGQERDVALFKKLQEAQKKTKNRLVLSHLANGFNRSDNWSFWQFGLPAIALTQDWENDFNPYYHTQKDTPKNLNFTYLRKIIQVMDKMVNVEPPPKKKEADKSEEES